MNKIRKTAAFILTVLMMAAYLSACITITPSAPETEEAPGDAQEA